MKFNAKALWLLAGSALASGCSALYTPGMGELRQLCEKDGGVTIHREVRVEGYYNDSLEQCNGCWLDITGRGFEYIEFENRKPSGYKYFGEAGGYHRVFKAPKGHPSCNERIWKFDMSRRVGSPSYQPFLENHCIASEPIEQPTAKYGYFEESREWTVNEWYGSTIGRFYAEVRDMESGEVASERVIYHLNPWPKSDLAYGKVISCSKVLPRGRINQPMIQSIHKDKDVSQ